MISELRGSLPAPRGLARRRVAGLRWTLVVSAMVAVSHGAAAQQQPAAPGGARPTRVPQAIEIRGQVPTPQVVTVRPRQMPVFSRDVLTPAYFDQHFRPWLLAPYEIAPNLSAESGVAPTTVAPPTLPTDSAYRPSPAADSTRVSAPSQSAPSASPPPAPPTQPQPTSPSAPREK